MSKLKTTLFCGLLAAVAALLPMSNQLSANVTAQPAISTEQSADAQNVWWRGGGWGWRGGWGGWRGGYYGYPYYRGYGYGYGYPYSYNYYPYSYGYYYY